MPWLPGIDPSTWGSLGDSRMAFLERYASGLPAGAEYPQAARFAAADALTSAAELAFATNQSERAFSLVERALKLLLSVPDVSEWSTHRVAVLGAITGRITTSLYFQPPQEWIQGIPEFSVAIALHDEMDGRRLDTKLQASAAVLQRTLGGLISSSVASGEPTETLGLFVTPAPPLSRDGRKVFEIAMSTMEVDTLPLFNLVRHQNGMFESRYAEVPSVGSLGAFIALGQRYAARLRLVAVDHERWARARSRVPLIDWSLLALHVAKQRRLRVPLEQFDSVIQAAGGGAGELHRFLSDIAQQVRPQGQRVPTR
jgi:hypothetical protein